MAEEHIGCLVQIDCGHSLGSYQGRISDVDADQQTITLEQPLRNGVPFQVPKITLRSEDIVDLRILQLADEFERTVSDVLSSCRSNNGKSTSAAAAVFDDVEKQAGIHEKIKAVRKQQQRVRISPDNLLRSNERKKSTKFEGGGASPSNLLLSNNRSRSRPNEEEENQYYQQQYHQNQQNKHFHNYQQHGGGNGRKLTALSDLCAPLDFDLLAEDFDFEANLAKFEKLPRQQGVAWSGEETRSKQEAALGLLLNNLEMGGPTNIMRNMSSSPSVRRNIPHDENIVHDPSRVYVNAKRSWRYLTEEGVEVQSLNATQKRQLFDRALAGGYLTSDGFAYSMADNAAKLCSKLIQEKSITSCRVLVIFSTVDPIPTQIAKHISRYLINRGHSSITWIGTDGGGGIQLKQDADSEFGDDVEILNSGDNPPAPAADSFALILGRQGSLADQVSSWLWKWGGNLSGIMFVECDWRGVNTTTTTNNPASFLIPDEDLLLRLGLDQAGSLITLPSRSILCWQAPCEEVDSNLKSPVYICDTNLPARFMHGQLTELGKLQKVAGKTYKFPFTPAQGSFIKLRKL